jgi:hypothetical protein
MTRPSGSVYGPRGQRTPVRRSTVSPAPASRTRLTVLPAGHMVPGIGYRAGDGRHPRGECALYDDCLGAHAHAYREGQAHCRLDCRWWEAAPPGPGATAYQSANGAAWGRR